MPPDPGASGLVHLGMIYLAMRRGRCGRCSGRLWVSGLSASRSPDLRLADPIKRHAHPFFFAPDNVAGYPLPVGVEGQCEMVRYASGARHLERRAHDGHVADHAIDSVAVELNCSGSQHIETGGTARLHMGMMCRAVLRPR